MFEFNSDDVGNSSSGGVDGNVLIPHRFFWPHGGRSIFLCGSFTGWSERIPMSPMEGHPTIFQAICNLTPGCHQYKFNVDGEWRYDEHQDFVSGSYGVVNTVSLARETDMIPSANASSLGGVNMEVDYHAHLAPPSDGTMLYLITEADLRVACQRISVFMTQHTAYELLPESGKVVALDVTLPVKQAFHILYEQGVPVAPLWDSGKGHFVGVVSAIDFILILRELGNHGSNLTEEELETHTILAWKDGKVRRSKQIDGHDGIRIPFLKPLINAGPYDSLKDVALKILQNKVSMVPIIHSSSPDGSFPQLLHLASLSGILKCICRHYRHSRSSLPILQQPIFSIPLGTWVPKIGDPSQPPFAMLRPSALLGDALSLFVEANVSSIPIVDENDSLLDIYSRSDITSLAKDRAYEQIRMDEMTIYQALQLRQDANSPCGVFDGQRCQMCLRTDPLYKVMEKLSNPGVRRLVIVEAGSKRVEGIITLSDVFRFLLG